LEILKAERQLFLLQIEQIFFRTEMPLTVSTLAEAMNISERSLYRSFQQHDLTPGICLKELRLKKAKYLLKDSNDTEAIRKVAQNVGYTEHYLRKLINETIP
jgi:transcriptional regulator GlxA family with amidase domain